jgi:hypothetical protein
MFRVNGIGTTVYGKAAQVELQGDNRVSAIADGSIPVSYQAIKWFTLFFVPLIPLGTYRIVATKPGFITSASYRMVRVAWDWRQVATHYAIGAFGFLLFYGLVAFIHRQ